MKPKDWDLVARAKLILDLREQMLHPHENLDDYVEQMDAVVRNWHSGVIVAPDTGLGSEEARVGRARVFYEYLVRAMLNEATTHTPTSLVTLLYISTVHIQSAAFLLACLADGFGAPKGDAE